MADPQATGPAEGWTWADAKDTTPQSTGPQIGPAFRGTALPPDTLGQRDLLGPEARKKLTTPLADTGIGLVDDLTTPANIVGALVVGGMAAKEAQAAGSVASRALAGMKGVVSSAAPAIKYEIIKTALSAARVPPSIAMGTALIMSGYQKSGAKPVAETPVAAKPVAAEVPVVAKPVKATPVAKAPVEVAPVAKAPAPSASPEFETVPKQSAAEALAAKFGTPTDLDMVKSLVAKGNSAAAAVKTVAGGDAKRFGALMTAYMQSRQATPQQAQQPAWKPNPNDVRADGSQKGTGFLGVLQRPDGRVSSEISVGVNIGGKEVEIPTLVPTLSQQEKQWLIMNDVSDPKKIPASIIQKAVDFARTRIAAGKSPFAQPGEGPKQ